MVLWKIVTIGGETFEVGAIVDGKMIDRIYRGYEEGDNDHHLKLDHYDIHGEGDHRLDAVVQVMLQAISTIHYREA